MTSKPTDFAGLLERLLAARVEFILVGGVAAIVHGSARATFDVAIVSLDKGVPARQNLTPFIS